MLGGEFEKILVDSGVGLQVREYLRGKNCLTTDQFSTCVLKVEDVSDRVVNKVAAAKDDDGVRAPLPPLLPQSPAAAALGLPEHADLAKTRERADVACICEASSTTGASRNTPSTTFW